MTAISYCPDVSAKNNAGVTNLRCEYLSNPLGIEETKPRLSWQLGSAQRGQKQKAYRILAASSPEKLSEDIGDLWDSGKVDSDQSLAVIYAGNPLHSRMQCFWKVKVWLALPESGCDKDGSLPWSKAANWSMGLLEQCQWKGRWIGLKVPEAVEKSEDQRYRIPARYLRKEFALGKSVKQATAYICGLGYYKLFINGGRIGDHEMDPILRDYEKQLPYVTYDVTTSLQKGQNVLGVMLGSGRFWAPRPEQQKYGEPCLRMQLEVLYEDNTTVMVLSDKTWQVTDMGPIRENNEYDGETYDARMEIANWNNAGCTFEQWKPADLMDYPFSKQFGALTSAALMPPMRITGTLKPVKLTEPKKASGSLTWAKIWSACAALRWKAPPERPSRCTLPRTSTPTAWRTSATSARPNAPTPTSSTAAAKKIIHSRLPITAFDMSRLPAFPENPHWTP
jgi:alpha-L-rhamnosidase